MCKLYTASGKLNKATALRATLATAAVFQATQRDGFGFVTAGDTVARGRYLDSKKYGGWGLHFLKAYDTHQLEEGTFPDSTHMLIVHGRTSTNVKGVANCHPFRNKDLYLAHNGILDWAGSANTEPSPRNGCDTHQWLNWIAKGGTWADCQHMWRGYAAAFLYNSKTKMTTVIKCGSARLFIAKRKTTVGWVFSSSAEDLVKISKAAGIALASRPIEVPQSIAVIGPDGDFVQDEKWAGFAVRRFDNATVRSLGRAATKDILKTYCGEKEMFPDWEPGLQSADEAVQPDANESGDGISGALSRV